MTLEWIGEPYPAHGGLAADGMSRLLGRPELPVGTVLVRELAQNSWDARTGTGPVRFTVRGRTLATAQAEALRAAVFGAAGDVPRGVLDPLRSTLRRNRIEVLVMSDRNTRGLAGPDRADQPGSPRDYVDFVLNVGVPRSEEGAGGTYGFGRTIAYHVSRAHTIVLFTRTTDEAGRPVERLIAASLGPEFEHNGRLHTGRHWWGLRDTRSGAPLPLTGPQATRLAEQIGLGTEEGPGTDIMILDPHLHFDDSESADIPGPGEALHELAEEITWQLWPKMLPREKPPMEFSVLRDETPIPVPEPENHPVLRWYAAAYRRLDRPTRGGDEPGWAQPRPIRRYRERVGTLAMQPYPSPADDRDRRPGRLHPPAPVHVALLRSPRLVVRYMPVPAGTDAATAWAGVFVASEEHDDAFAAAEPPTHDDWNPAHVDDQTQRSIVRVALRRIREAAGDVVRPPDDEMSSVAESTHRVATLLGDLVGVAGRPTPGSGRPERRKGGGGRRGLRVIVDPRSTVQRVEDDGWRTYTVRFSVENPTGVPGLIRIRVAAATETGRLEKEPPEGAQTPGILRILGPDTEIDLQNDFPGSYETEVGAATAERWRVEAAAPPDTALVVTVDPIRAAGRS